MGPMGPVGLPAPRPSASLQLPDWTGRQARADKTGQIPVHLEPILTRLDCSPDVWLDLVQNFRRQCPVFRKSRPFSAVL